MNASHFLCVMECVRTSSDFKSVSMCMCVGTHSGRANECEKRTREVMIDAAPIKYNRTPGRFLGNDTHRESEFFFSNSISYMIHNENAFAGKFWSVFDAHIESVSSLSNENVFLFTQSMILLVYEEEKSTNMCALICFSLRFHRSNCCYIFL